MPWAVRIAAGGAFALTALVRYLAVEGFSNDHFLHLAGAGQVLAGEWPTRDFNDPGMPLMYLASAGAQLAFGRTLFAEAVLVSSAYGLAAALTLAAAHRLSRSIAAAVAAAALSVAAFPVSYSYPKLLLYAALVLLACTWHTRPAIGRLVSLAALVDVAFLFRHDHGVYLGAVALATVVLTAAGGIRKALTNAVLFGAVALLVLAPYLAYVQWHEGLGVHLADGLEFARREADRSRLHLEASPWIEVQLFYGFHALPLVVLGWVAIDVRPRVRNPGSQIPRHPSIDLAVAAPLACLAILVNRAFLRDPLSARLPDVIVPAVLLLAWLAGRALRLTRRRARVASLAVTLLAASAGADAVFQVGRTREQIGRTHLSLGLGRLPAVVAQKTGELQARFSPRQVPDGRLAPLIPFFEYLDRCTTPRHRLFVTGFAPEVFVYARRPFAGGQSTFVEGYFSSADREARILGRLERQLVAFVLVPAEEYPTWEREFPRLARFIDSSFQRLTDVEAPGRTMRVLVSRGRPPLATDRETGWPCYVRH
jgi:hypothetical protein